ncbi:GNAT family N-acetyltransferase [Breznakiella homolactica]|uniref:GNAT family N-acetyltransferase n=1 Tax=Breznakiella homolactica TaxID=2798577 RepID=A0A7T7XK85_9SPIR|nr:GNAT family N-acetyltransferase [Breznakiella homolactica]QQO07708.1 GNAT family N-acetyltransferase [Breznakiella homolactica]
METIKPITLDGWLPDRCLSGQEPFDPVSCPPEAGCPGINYSIKHNRETLERLYRSAIETYGGCGFITWERDRVIACHTFFPLQMAKDIKFYGHGSGADSSGRVLVHNCLTAVGGDYARKGIGSRLVTASLDWAKANGWDRFEVHRVLPASEKGWRADQKSCLPFWERFGFRVFREYEAEPEAEAYYGVKKQYSLCLAVGGWR